MKIINLINRLGCHRRADRSFFYKGKQFPVCARCTGVFVGELLSIFIYPLYKIGYLVSFIFMMVMFVDWFVQYLGIKESTNIRRFITGIIAGYGVTFIQIDLLLLLIKRIIEI